MAFRSEAHETLLLLFARYEVLPACICNNAKKMIQGKFYQKLKDAACNLKQLEPHTPWSNAAEREIKELEKGASHNLLLSEYQSTCRMTAWSWKPILGPILCMRFLS